MTNRRHHIVLVPGFGGFDALGQIRYYTGITALFEEWKTEISGVRAEDTQSRPPIELHYFDNLPTSSVKVRAAMLLKYLAKRIARESFQFDGADRGDRSRCQFSDTITLVGHSTGGLDIRKLVWDLRGLATSNPPQLIPVVGDDVDVDPEDMLQMISGLVFLSTPQYGTNIADWVRSHAGERLTLIRAVHFAVSWGLYLVPDKLLDYYKPHAFDRNLGLAILDALRESSPLVAGESGNEATMAEARAAASDLNLWLSNIDTDFAAIDDLRSFDNLPANDQSDSPAHYTAEEREKEMAFWRSRGILTRSYATVGTRLHYDYKEGAAAPIWNTLFDPLKSLREYQRHKTSDFTYATAYLCTSGGIFTTNSGRWTVKDLTGSSDVTTTIEQWDNDGIVNTASMLWPDGRDTRLVHGDHGDIIGHFRLVRSPDPNAPRRYSSYDIFLSGSGFDPTQFSQVWKAIFAFSADPQPKGAESV